MAADPCTLDAHPLELRLGLAAGTNAEPHRATGSWALGMQYLSGNKGWHLRPLTNNATRRVSPSEAEISRANRSL